MSEVIDYESKRKELEEKQRQIEEDYKLYQEFIQWKENKDKMHPGYRLSYIFLFLLMLGLGSFMLYTDFKLLRIMFSCLDNGSILAGIGWLFLICILAIVGSFIAILGLFCLNSGITGKQ